MAILRARRWRESLALGLPLAALGALSLYHLGAPSLWRDEVASVIFAKGSLPELLTIVGRDRDAVGLANMATYYLLLHFWLFIGETEARIRLLSVIFGVASVVPVYFIARRLAGWLAGGLAAGIFVLIPYVIHYSQEARGYSLAMLVAGSLTWLLLIGVERRTVWPWAAYGLIAALGLYVHFFVALIVAAHGLWVLATRSLPPWRSALAALLPILLAAAPIPFIIAQFGGGQEWIPPLTVSQAATSIVSLAGGLPLLLAMAVLVAVAVITRSRDSRTWLMIGCIVATIAGAALISIVKPMFVGRYLIVVLPHVAVLIGCALIALRPIILRGAVVALLAVLLGAAIPSAYADQHQQDWRSAGTWMAERAQPGDRMIAGNGLRSIAYYLGRVATSPLPRSTTAAAALADPTGGRLWLVLTGRAANSRIRSRLVGRFVVEEERAFGADLTIALLVTKPTTPGAS
ncbi:MAG: glycosyltransferase family 39 protein [Chloroflexota bacterium]